MATADVGRQQLSTGLSTGMSGGLAEYWRHRETAEMTVDDDARTASGTGSETRSELPPGVDRARNVEPMALGQTLRSLRRAADLSQRQLGALAGVPASTVARIESGNARDPRFRTVERLVQAADAALCVAGPAALAEGTPAEGMPAEVPHETLRDRGGRRYPAHLDPVEVTRPEQWWGAWWAASVIRSKWPVEEVPPYTYELSRFTRDERRERAVRRGRVAVRGDRRELPGGVAGWVWTAHADGEVVGELWAHEFDEGVDGMRWHFPTPVPAGTGVLDGVAVLPDWQRLGIGRRMVAALRADVDGGLISLAWGSSGFLEACGFSRSFALPAPMWFHAVRPE
jgi:transcriptional regulator with XRE-family HTH domain